MVRWLVMVLIATAAAVPGLAAESTPVADAVTSLQSSPQPEDSGRLLAIGCCIGFLGLTLRRRNRLPQVTA